MNLDPELAAALPTLPDLHIHDLAGARARMRELALCRHLVGWERYSRVI